MAPVEIEDRNGHRVLEENKRANYEFKLKGNKRLAARFVTKPIEQLEVSVPLGYVAKVDGRVIREGTIYIKRGKNATIHRFIPFGIVRKKAIASLSLTEKE